MAPFKWRKNSTKEVRHMRNQRKKRKRLQKKNIPSVTVAKENYERLIQKEQAQKGRSLFLARKYYLKWKAVKEAHRHLHAKANPTNVVCGSGLKFLNGARLLSVTTAGNIRNGISEISRNLLVAARDKKGNESKEFLGKGTFGKCFKMYFKGMPVAVKEFNNLSTAEAVRHEALVMSKCCHPSLPHLFNS